MDRLQGVVHRVSLCVQCAAPVALAAQGGTAVCTQCGAPNELRPRDDRPLGYGGAPAQEAMRLQLLRQQDGRPLVPPPSVLQLLEAGSLPQWKVQEATMLWQQARRESAATQNPDAAERLFFLTLSLADYFTDAGDLLRVQGLYESALDALPLPRQKQMMRGALSRLAVRAGDLAAAEMWLAPCDARSDDLQSDSAWRLARAMIDTARGDHPAVFAVLGGRFEDVPVLDAMDAMAVLLRANAWERSGNLDAAFAALMAYLTRAGASGRQTVRKTAEAHPALGLCPQSLNRAEQTLGAQAAQAAAARASVGLHTVFVPVGVLLLLIALVAGGAGVLGALGLLHVRPGAGWRALGQGLPGAIFLVVGLVMARSAKRAARLRTHGLQGAGRVLGVEYSGVRIHNVPQMRVNLEVSLPGQPPYPASTKVLMHSHLAAQFAPGVTVAVRVDPKDPRVVLIASD
jgi:hypothetical protein